MPVTTVPIAVTAPKAGVALQLVPDSGHCSVLFVDGDGVPTGNPGVSVVLDPNGGFYLLKVSNPGQEWLRGPDGRVRIDG